MNRSPTRATPLAARTILLFGIAALLCVACASTPQTETRTVFDFMDTVSTATLPASNIALADRLFDLCRDLDARLNAHDPSSEVGKLNAADGERVNISSDVSTLLNIGKEYFEKSGGLFDITIAPISLLWDFSSNSLPQSNALASAIPLVGADRLELGGGWARLPVGFGVDLGALVKGYALDRCADTLRAEGVPSALINLGGSVLALGKRLDGNPWRVGVQLPFGAEGATLGVLSVTDTCVVTAGLYERSFELDGKLYHHILDPRTGMPAATDLYSATIIYKNALIADAYSTWCIMAGAEKALGIVESADDMECVLYTADGSLMFSSGIGSAIPFELTGDGL
ncbi:MAG: FAD:protein FMN transferase [Oscillospiraceae bacterium]|jgi:thiamine biosynthesis lipoprotein|nr:FAD:protein FMN transferase [Oscillospiraceae bacterium]